MIAHPSKALHHSFPSFLPRCRKQIGDRSFRVSGPTLWNKLPQSLRMSPSINVFKCNLKTYFSSDYQLLMFSLCMYV